MDKTENMEKNTEKKNEDTSQTNGHLKLRIRLSRSQNSDEWKIAENKEEKEEKTEETEEDIGRQTWRKRNTLPPKKRLSWNDPERERMKNLTPPRRYEPQGRCADILEKPDKTTWTKYENTKDGPRRYVPTGRLKECVEGCKELMSRKTKTPDSTKQANERKRPSVNSEDTLEPEEKSRKTTEDKAEEMEEPQRENLARILDEMENMIKQKREMRRKLRADHEDATKGTMKFFDFAWAILAQQMKSGKFITDSKTGFPVNLAQIVRMPQIVTEIARTLRRPDEPEDGNQETSDDEERFTADKWIATAKEALENTLQQDDKEDLEARRKQEERENTNSEEPKTPAPQEKQCPKGHENCKELSHWAEPQDKSKTCNCGTAGCRDPNHHDKEKPNDQRWRFPTPSSSVPSNTRQRKQETEEERKERKQKERELEEKFARERRNDNATFQSKAYFTRGWIVVNNHMKNGAFEINEQTGLPKDLWRITAMPEETMKIAETLRSKRCICGAENCNQTSHWVKKTQKTEGNREQICECGGRGCKNPDHREIIEISPEEKEPRRRADFPTPRPSVPSTSSEEDSSAAIRPNVPSTSSLGMASSKKILEAAKNAPWLRKPAKNGNYVKTTKGTIKTATPGPNGGPDQVQLIARHPLQTQHEMGQQGLTQLINHQMEQSGHMPMPYRMSHATHNLPFTQEAGIGLPAISQPIPTENPPKILPLQTRLSLHSKNDLPVPAFSIPANTYWILRAAPDGLNPNNTRVTFWPLQAPNERNTGRCIVTPLQTLTGEEEQKQTQK